MCRLRVYTQVHYIPSRVYTQVIHRFTIYQVAYIRRFAIYQVGYTRRLYTQVDYIQRRVYTRDCRSKVTYAYACTFMHRKARTCGKAYFGSVVFIPMVLVLGIASEVLIPSIGSMVLICYGFGPWYDERPKTIKGEEDHQAKAWKKS